jgi:transcriptional regulator with XRE-family HTH domain
MQQSDYLRRTGVDAGRNQQFNQIADAWRLEELRQALRRELRTHMGQLALARIIGVGRSVVRKLLEMRTVPEPRNLDRLREWAADRPAVETPVEVVCLAVLVEDLPADARYDARLELAGMMARLYERADAEIPKWLTLELEDRGRRP